MSQILTEPALQPDASSELSSEKTSLVIGAGWPSREVTWVTVNWPLVWGELQSELLLGDAGPFTCHKSILPTLAPLQREGKGGREGEGGEREGGKRGRGRGRGGREGGEGEREGRERGRGGREGGEGEREGRERGRGGGEREGGRGGREGRGGGRREGRHIRINAHHCPCLYAYLAKSILPSLATSECHWTKLKR
jgi:hypothetical protein